MANRYYPLSLTDEQQQSIQDSGGYYDDNDNWVDMSGTSGGGGGQPQQPKTGGSQGGQQQGGGGLNPWLGILTALGGAAGGAYLRNRSQANAVPPELRQLLTQSVNRQAFQNPLFEANTRGTYQMLPTFATGGGAMPGGHLSNQAPEIPTNSGGSDDPDNPLTSWNPLKNPLLAGALGALLRGGIPGTGGQGDLGKLLGDLGRLFHRGDQNIFGGRQTYSGHAGGFDPLGGADNPYYYGNLPGGGGGVMPGLPGSGNMPWPFDPYEPGGPSFSGPMQDPYEPGGPLFSGPMQGGGDNNPGGGDWGDGGWWTDE